MIRVFFYALEMNKNSKVKGKKSEANIIYPTKLCRENKFRVTKSKHQAFWSSISITIFPNSSVINFDMLDMSHLAPVLSCLGPIKSWNKKWAFLDIELI